MHAPQGAIPLLGFVSAVTGTSPGPASGIKYKVTYTNPHGGGTIETLLIVPSNRRPPDTYDIDAYTIGDPVHGFDNTNQLVWFFNEQLAKVDCGSSPPPPGLPHNDTPPVLGPLM